MEAKEGESWNLLSPSPLGRPDTQASKSPDQKFEVKEIGDYKSDYYFKLQNGKKCDAYTHGENEPTLGRASDHLL